MSKSSQLELNIVTEINALHSELCGLARMSLEKAIRIGELLTDQKSKLKHGEWLPWCRQNLEFSQASATKYLTLFRDREKLLAASNLGVDEAYRLLAAPTETDEQQEFAAGVDEAGVQLSAISEADEDAHLELTQGSELSEIPLNSATNKPHVVNNSGENEWYTPKAYIDSAVSVMGGIDLDPASCELANESIGAKRIFTKEINGLRKKWKGRIWLNPPYAQPLIAEFAEKVASEYEAGSISQACVLVNNATDTSWFQRMMKSASAVCFPKGRIRFIDKYGNPSGAPLQGQAVLYFGENGKAFNDVFSKFGFVK